MSNIIIVIYDILRNLPPISIILNYISVIVFTIMAFPIIRSAIKYFFKEFILPIILVVMQYIGLCGLILWSLVNYIPSIKPIITNAILNLPSLTVEDHSLTSILIVITIMINLISIAYYHLNVNSSIDKSKKLTGSAKSCTRHMNNVHER